LKGCKHDQEEGCDKLARLLQNVVRVMMVRWNVPSWDGFSYNLKIAKYVMWVWMMAAGKFDVYS